MKVMEICPIHSMVFCESVGFHINLITNALFSFFQVSLVPDPQKRTHCKTTVVHDTGYPTFDQKFSL